MKSLLLRLASALVAILAMGVAYYFFQIESLRLLALLTSLLGLRELNRILFRASEPKSLIWILNIMVVVVSSSFIYIGAGTLGLIGFLFYSVAMVVFCAVAVVYESHFPSLEALHSFISKSFLTLFYVGLLPGAASLLLNLEAGASWFFGLLSVVFAGDVLAYVFGILFGKRKLLPNISPKKTVAGSFGGLLGSIAVGTILSEFIPNLNPLIGALLGLIAGATAQLGDFFESLLKRVAQVKDSGTLMPGHGGVLDRLDGVLFGAPVFVFFAFVIRTFS